MVVTKETMKKAIKDVWIRSLTVAPPDIIAALKDAQAHESNERAKQYLSIMLENITAAGKNRSCICQDTGLPTFYIRTSLGFPYIEDIQQTFDEAMREMTLDEFPMRSMVVNPVTRAERGDNTGEHVPLLHTELCSGLDYFEIMAIPKGAGSGMWSTMTILPPAKGIKGIEKFVVDSVLHAGSNPCPPIIVGVGIGGTMSEVCHRATLASVRPLNLRNPEPVFADMEKNLKDALNLSKIGVMGLGGDNTVLGVNVECSAAHNPWLPVAVNINCWPGRRAMCRVYNDGSVRQLEEVIWGER